jgi:hypothetical protein
MAEDGFPGDVRKIPTIVDIARHWFAIASPYPGTQRAQFDL